MSGASKMPDFRRSVSPDGAPTRPPLRPRGGVPTGGIPLGEVAGAPAASPAPVRPPAPPAPPKPPAPPAPSAAAEPPEPQKDQEVAASPVARPVTPVRPPAPATTPTPATPVASGGGGFKATNLESVHASSKFLFALLDHCGANGVSDLHVHPDKGMWRLTSGVLVKDEEVEDTMITEEEILHWMTHADGYDDMGVSNPEELLGTKGHTTVAFDTGTWRIRGSFRRSTVGVSCTFRLIPSTIPTIEDVELPQVMVDMIRRPSGLILIEGPTGSGKTTSIAALINYINQHTDQHIYSIEDPIEFYHQPIGNTVFTMREVGIHASDYPSSVENALRSKPNIIFVGEMLSNETKKSALHASTTGHLVITTAHAGSVVEALDSFIGEFSAEEQPQIRGRLSQSILGVMCQTLVPATNGKLVAAREIMLANMNFREIIMDGNMHMLHAQMESGVGCQTLEDDLVRLAVEGRITTETALARAKNEEVIRAALIRKNLISE